MPTIKGKKCADLVIGKWGMMKNDEDFDSFFEVVKKAANLLKPVRKPTLSKKRKKPNYSILKYITGYEGPESNAYHRQTARDYIKRMYFQALDAVISAINERQLSKVINPFTSKADII